MPDPLQRDGGPDAPAVPPSLDTFDHNATIAEGWAVFDCGRQPDATPRVELQRIDCPEDGSEPRFEDDQDAWRHVVSRAREGSALHLAALGLIDVFERASIEGMLGSWSDGPAGPSGTGGDSAQVPPC